MKVEDETQRTLRPAEECEELARASSASAEVLAELEASQERLSNVGRDLGAANARSAALAERLQNQREELEWTNAQLTAVNEQTKHVLAVMAHDLQGGLGGITSLVDQVASDLREIGQVDSGSLEFLDLVAAEGDRLRSLLEELLLDVRAARHPDSLREQDIDLCSMIDSVVMSHLSSALRKHQSITALAFETGEDAVPGTEVRVDPVYLRQILDNLLSNAIKYSPQGGSIEIQVRKALPTAGRVSLSICDRGPGFTAQDLEKIFGEFTTLSARPTGGELSHGLGLAIVRRLVELHGGRIEARNRSDGGAEFVFDLPLVD
ncbi:MAG: sensor histidine kinase [Planctomycetota bacterium]